MQFLRVVTKPTGNWIHFSQAGVFLLQPVIRFHSWQEEALDAIRIPDSNLNVVSTFETSSRIWLVTFPKYTSNRVKSVCFAISPSLMDGHDHGTITWPPQHAV